MKHYIYILQSEKTGRYYVGSTKDPESRLRKHNKGDVKSTKPYRPWKIIYNKSFDTRNEAEIRERQIKSWKSRDDIERLINKC